MADSKDLPFFKDIIEKFELQQQKDNVAEMVDCLNRMFCRQQLLMILKQELMYPTKKAIVHMAWQLTSRSNLGPLDHKQYVQYLYQEFDSLVSEKLIKSHGASSIEGHLHDNDGIYSLTDSGKQLESNKITFN